METHRKFKKQRQPLYNAEGVIEGTLNILPNLRKLKIDKINQPVKNPHFKFVVDSSGKISGFKRHPWPMFDPTTGAKHEYTTPEDTGFYYDDDNFLGVTELSRMWSQMLEYAKWNSAKVKNPEYIGYEETNKLVNKIVKEKIYNKSFYKRYFRPIRIDCKGNEGACKFHGTFITLKTWADDSVLLHELAHQYGRDHDSRFATAYLMLVGRFLGHDQQIKLMDSMRKYNVEWNGTFQHSKKCFTEHGYTDRAKNAGGQCTTGATKMNLGFKTEYLHKRLG